MGAPPLVDPQGEYDSYQIALKELKEHRIPIIIRRTLPDGSHEDWRIIEMTV
jgi:DNA-directed RNA polymerase I, II, and III subunit RPABC2